MKFIQCVLVAIALLSGVAMADNLNPPPWDPYSDGTTHAEWEFLTDSMTPAADVLFNPYGETLATVFPGAGQSWHQSWGGRDGVWPLSGLIDIAVDNRPEPLERKEIWLQVTWAPQMESTCIEPIVQELIFHPDLEVIGTIELEPTGEDYPAGSKWYHTTYRMIIMPNPDFEVIRIGGAVMVDEIVLDTICIPEPASMSLLAAGAAAMVNIKRRKRS